MCVQVRAKAAEIEQSVYGPKESNSLGPPGVFLPEQTDAAKVKVVSFYTNQLRRALA